MTVTVRTLRRRCYICQSKPISSWQKLGKSWQQLGNGLNKFLTQSRKNFCNTWNLIWFNEATLRIEVIWVVTLVKAPNGYIGHWPCFFTFPTLMNRDHISQRKVWISFESGFSPLSRLVDHSSNLPTAPSSSLQQHQRLSALIWFLAYPQIQMLSVLYFLLQRNCDSGNFESLLLGSPFLIFGLFVQDLE